MINRPRNDTDDYISRKNITTVIINVFHILKNRVRLSMSCKKDPN